MDKKYTNHNETTFQGFYFPINFSTTLILLFLIFISFVSCLRSDKVKNTALTEFKSAIDSLYNANIPSDGPGAAVLVSYQGDKLISKGYGLRNLEAHKPVTQSTNFRIASVSKQFTALCILKLVEEGKLSLQDSVIKYLPYPIFHNMTIEQLINHTSGLPAFDDYFLNQWDRARIVENKDVLDWLIKQPKPNYKPGENFEYSNTAYLMLALIVEEVSEMEFSIYASKHVFQPLGMDSTNYFSLAKPVKISQRALCYEQDSTGKYEKKDGFFLNGIMGDGALYTSINDYYHYDISLREKTFLSAPSQKLLFKPSSTEKRTGRQNRNYAMGWYVTDTAAYHTGGWLGANAFVMRYLDKPLTVAIFMNNNTLFKSGLIDKTLNLSHTYLEEIKR